MTDPHRAEREKAWARKRAWHREQAALPITEKVRILLELQRQDYPILAARGALREWERPWPDGS